MNNHSENVWKALSVTSEVCGATFSEPAAHAIMRHLQAYPEQAVLKSLSRCQSELTGKLTLAAIIQRIDDGRPDADEAWSIAIASYDESDTVITNSEIAEAYGIAQPIYEDGDKIGARMAFRSAYERITQNNKQDGINPRWWPSRGFDKTRAEEVLTNSPYLKHLSQEQIVAALPYKGATTEGFVKTLALESKENPATKEHALAALENIKKLIGGLK